MSADELAKRLPKKRRTEEELKELKRFDIRYIATEHFGMDSKACSKMSTSDVTAFILEAQEKEFGKGGKAAAAPKGKAAAAPPKGKGKPAPEPEPEPEPEETEEAEEAEASGDLEGKIDALGQAFDSFAEETREKLEAIETKIAEMQHNQFMVFGLVSNLFLISEGEDALNERLEELQSEWEKEGNG